MAQDPTVVAVNAGTPMILFTPEQRKIAGSQFVDVGIAEEHAATMTAGLAKWSKTRLGSFFNLYATKF